MIETHAQTGGYLLGFRLDPPERMKDVSIEMGKLHKLYSESPTFGVSVDRVAKTLAVSAPPPLDESDDIEQHTDNDVFALYFADSNKEKDRDIVFNNDIGLATEQLKEGVTMASLWNVV